MALDSGILRFGAYRFDYNPHTLSLQKTKRLTQTPLANSRTLFQEMGYHPMVISGEGTLIGDDVMAKAVALEHLLSESESALLTLPELTPFYCYFQCLELIGKAGPKMLTYRFTFVEDTEKATTLTAAKRYLVAEKGDTLATIAAKYGCTTEQLLAANPALLGCIDLAEGTVLWLP